MFLYELQHEIVLNFALRLRMSEHFGFFKSFATKISHGWRCYMILLYRDDHDYPHTNFRALSAQNAELQATNLLQQRRFRVLYRWSLALRGWWRGTRVISQMLKCTLIRIKAMKARRANGLTFLARFACIFGSLQFIFLCHSFILQA